MSTRVLTKNRFKGGTPVYVCSSNSTTLSHFYGPVVGWFGSFILGIGREFDFLSSILDDASDPTPLSSALGSWPDDDDLVVSPVLPLDAKSILQDRARFDCLYDNCALVVKEAESHYAFQAALIRWWRALTGPLFSLAMRVVPPIFLVALNQHWMMATFMVAVLFPLKILFTIFFAFFTAVHRDKNVRWSRRMSCAALYFLGALFVCCFPLGFFALAGSELLVWCFLSTRFAKKHMIIRVPLENMCPYPAAFMDDVYIDVPIMLAVDVPFWSLEYWYATGVSSIILGAPKYDINGDRLSLDAEEDLLAWASLAYTKLFPKLAASQSSVAYTVENRKGKTKKTFRGFHPRAASSGGTRRGKRVTNSQYEHFCRVHDYDPHKATAREEFNDLRGDFDAYVTYSGLSPYERDAASDEEYLLDERDDNADRRTGRYENENKPTGSLILGPPAPCGPDPSSASDDPDVPGCSNEARDVKSSPLCKLCGFRFPHLAGVSCFESSIAAGHTTGSTPGNADLMGCVCGKDNGRTHLMLRCPVLKKAVCVGCSMVGDHWSVTCPTIVQMMASNPSICSFCSKTGHTGREGSLCFEKQKYEDARARYQAIVSQSESRSTGRKVAFESTQASSFKMEEDTSYGAGVLFVGDKQIGTVFREANYVLTARHVVLEAKIASQGTTPVTIEWEDDSRGTSVVTGYSSLDTSGSILHDDWSYLQVPGPVPKAYKRYIYKGTTNQGTKLQCVAVGLDDSNQLSSYVGIATVDPTSKVQFHNATTHFGSSGGPVLVRDESQLRVAGIHIGCAGSQGNIYIPLPTGLPGPWSPFLSPEKKGEVKKLESKTKSKKKNTWGKKTTAFESKSPSPSPAEAVSRLSPDEIEAFIREVDEAKAKRANNALAGLRSASSGNGPAPPSNIL
jgi:hypothetical protein